MRRQRKDLVNTTPAGRLDARPVSTLVGSMASDRPVGTTSHPGTATHARDSRFAVDVNWPNLRLVDPLAK